MNAEMDTRPYLMSLRRSKDPCPPPKNKLEISQRPEYPSANTCKLIQGKTHCNTPPPQKKKKKKKKTAMTCYNLAGILYIP